MNIAAFHRFRSSLLPVLVILSFLIAPLRAAGALENPVRVQGSLPAGLSHADWSQINALIPAQQAYLKASNTGAEDNFGSSIAISGDTVVVGAYYEDSNAVGVNGNQNNGMAPDSGAAYVFTRNGTTWSQQAYLKASNTEFSDLFGSSVAVSGDTVVVGAIYEDSDAIGVNGNQNDNSSGSSGAAYVFVRSGTTWSQQAYLKASNTGAGDRFGHSIAIDGDTIVVGAHNEDGNAIGVGGNQADNSASNAGAAYIFTRSGTTWSQQAYIKASNTDANDEFGRSVAISGDTLVIGSWWEDGNATGVNGNQADNSSLDSGAAYVFTRSGITWSQQAYLKASNTEPDDRFGISVGISGDAVAVGAYFEDSNTAGVNGNQGDNSSLDSGAVYVFTRSVTTWAQQAYLKASNPETDDLFGRQVAISGDTVVVGAPYEDSNATGVNGNQNDNSALDSGAAYVFTRSGTIWSQQAYLKAPNTGTGDLFGWSVPISGDTVVIGARYEDSNATGVDGDGNNNSYSNSGAAYVYIPAPPCTPPPTAVPFTENFSSYTSSYFCSTNNVQMNVPTAGASDSKSAQFTLPAGVSPGPGQRAEIYSSFLQYGTFKARLKTSDCSTNLSTTGVITGFFTYHNYKDDPLSDQNGNGIHDNSEIDFEWLCKEPNIVYLSMYTDYQPEEGANPEKKRQLMRKINLANGMVLETVYRSYNEVTKTTDEIPLTSASENSPASISGLPSPYNSHTTFYEYGFSWASDRVTWWIINPANGQKVILWDYTGPSERITKRPARMMVNLWHTNNWIPGLTSPTSSVYSYVDWGGYSEASTRIASFTSVGSQDGHILESAETSNVGGTLDTSSTTFNLGDGAGDKQYRAVLSFNTASLPDTAVLTNVTLKIKKQGMVFLGTNPFTILGGLKVDIRNPFFGTTPGLVISDFQAAAAKSAFAAFSATPVSDWYSAVIGASGYPYINLTGTTQFRLRFANDDNNDNAADYMKFYSGNFVSAASRPVLILEYYVP